MTAALDLQPIAQIAAERIVDCLVQGLILLTLAGLFSRVIRRQDAGTRFAVWFSLLVAIAVLPMRSLIGQSDSTTSFAKTASDSAAFSVPGSWALYLFGVWAVIATFSLIRFGVGLRQLHTMRKNCRPIPPESLDPLLQNTLRQFRSRRRVTICTSAEIESPAAIGFFHPAVILPEWVIEELPPAELQQVLVHELTHLRRWDDWTNLAQKLIRALLFFHPAVWWIERKIALEREMACDDVVLAEIENPRSYAKCLVHIAEKSFLRRSLALAQAVVGRVRETAVRVARILDADRPQAMHGWKPAASLVAAIALLSFISSQHSPKLLAFQNNVLPVIATSTSPALPVSFNTANEFVPHTTFLKAVVQPKPEMQLASPPPRVANAKPRKLSADQNPAVTAASYIPVLLPAKYPASPDEILFVTETLFVVENSQSSLGLTSWQVRIWYIRAPQPGNRLDQEMIRKSI